ncbi:hypothetical protein [Streptomyces fradiae]|uniref:hypothetical protein n=1 Tax=Streptomyces fradiae TaxID=1906 RepID=UPI003411DAEE
MTQNRRHKQMIRAFQAATGTTYTVARRRQLSWPTLAEVMDEHNMLTDFGIGVWDSDRLTVGQRRAEIAAARDRLRREENLLLETAQWLRDHVMPIKTPSASSYAVKHLIEDATDVYMTNGVFIAAALIVGYPFRYAEPNVLFGMSRRDLNKLR